MSRSTVRRLTALSFVLAAAVTSARDASADDAPRPNAPSPPIAPNADTPVTTPAASVAPDGAQTADGSQTSTPGTVKPPKDPARKISADPSPSETPAPGRTTFDGDPIADGAVVAVSLGFAGVLDLINSTGEIRPQQISPNFQRSQLLGIDRGAISQTPDKNASTYSNVGLFVAVGFAVIDPILSGVREQSVQTGLVDGIMYAESVSLTFALTNLAKVAVRRPRPKAYIDAEAHKGDPTYSNADTDSSLSFFSGHAAITAAVGATATYLAFARAPHTWRPWVTLVVATAVGTFVDIERVRAGAHFPTDVIAGSIAGAGVGVVVPHLHRSEDIKQRRVWIGYAPVDSHDGARGGVLNVSGLF